MKSFLRFLVGACLPGLFVCVPAFAELPEKSGADWAKTLPEVLAEVDGKKYGKEDILALIPENKKKDADERTMRELVRKAVDGKIFYHVTLDLLKRNKICRNAAQTREYLKLIGGDHLSAEELRRLSLEPGIQLKAAVFLMFQKHYPEKLVVSGAETEAFYRKNQDRFLIPENAVYGILALPATVPGTRERVEAARLEVLQGADFERVASAADPEGRGKLLTKELQAMIPALKKMSVPGAISDVFQLKGQWVLVQVKAVNKAHYLPLPQAAPGIQRILVEEKLAASLQIMLKLELSGKKIKYHF